MSPFCRCFGLLFFVPLVLDNAAEGLGKWLWLPWGLTFKNGVGCSCILVPLISYSAADASESTPLGWGLPYTSLAVVTQYLWLFAAWQSECCNSSVLLEFFWCFLFPAGALQLFLICSDMLRLSSVLWLTYRCLQVCGISENSSEKAAEVCFPDYDLQLSASPLR